MANRFANFLISIIAIIFIREVSLDTKNEVWLCVEIIKDKLFVKQPAVIFFDRLLYSQLLTE
jgi:hypothetical protein